MKKVTRCILISTDEDRFADEVNHYLSEGFQPYGELHVREGGFSKYGHTTMLMVKYEDEFSLPSPEER